MRRKKTIKLHEEEYAMLKKAREVLIKRGTDTLPEPLRSKVSELIKNEQLTLGRMVGVVALALFETLTQGGESS